ncbi:hypothetical protein N9933_01395 [bacterium]|nr:hypothetical protein [bacterium]
MKALTAFTCILFLIGTPPIWGQTYTESMETLRFEIKNLREQIVFVIRDSDLNLRESDAAIEAQKARVRFLENQNTTLKTQPLSSKKGSKSRYEKEIATLKSENKDLWSELENGQIGTSQQIHNMVAKTKKLTEDLQKAESEKRNLQNKIESVRSYAAKQLDKNQADMMKTYSENKKLASELRSLKEQLNANTSYVGVNIAEREKLMAETANYKAKYDSLLYAHRSFVTAIQVSNKSTIRETLVIDSLEYANAKLRSLTSELMKSGTVDRTREKGIDLRERRIELEANRLEIREQMLKTRENDLKFKLQEITVKDAKFKNLKEKEKQLKLLEQKIRELIEKEGDS